MLFVLPTLEAPKNLLLVLYFAVWAVRRASLAALRAYRPGAVELALLAVVAACAASTLANWPFDNGTKGLSDTLRYAALFVCIYRAGYDERQHRTLAHAITWGMLAGLVLGAIELAAGRRPDLELHSAGPVTLSAMYVSTATLLAFGLFVTRWLPRGGAAGGVRRLWPWAAGSAAGALALVVMASRGALLTVGGALVLLGLLVRRARLWRLLGLVALAAVLVALAALHFGGSGDLAQSVRSRYATGRLAQSDFERTEIYRIGIAQVLHGGSPWLGIGPRNFHSIDIGRFHFDPPLRVEGGVKKLSHGHNLFLTKLVEEGVVGLAAFLFFWGVVARELARAWRTDAWYEWRWISALGAVSVSLVTGSVNTPFYQEPALLAVTLLAMFFAARRAQRQP